MTYQDLVARVIACKSADLELGLSRAREQAPFIEGVARVLDKTSWDYRVRLSMQFQTTFHLEWGLVEIEHQITAVQQALAEVYEVQRVGDELLVESVQPDGYSCRVVFGDVPQ